jgi:hypothetical protein
LWFAVTRNPTAEWLARQITEAFPWDRAPKYLIRDNDRAFGVMFKARIRAMGIRDRPTSFHSLWQKWVFGKITTALVAILPRTSTHSGVR